MIKFIKNLAESLFENLGIVAAPLAAASLIGLSIFLYLNLTLHPAISTSIAVLFAFSLEAAGYLSFQAYQKDGDIKKPIGYLSIIILVSILIEGYIQQDLSRMALNFSGALIAAIVYWSFSSQHAEMNQLAADIEATALLTKNGMYVGRDGKVKQRKTATKSTATIATSGTAIPLRKSMITPEVRTDILQLSWRKFVAKYSSQFAVKESTYQTWKREFKSAGLPSVESQYVNA